MLHETEKVLDVLDIHVRADDDGDNSFVQLLNLAPTSQVKRVHLYCEDFRFDKLRVTTSKSGVLTCRVQHPRYIFKNLDINDGYQRLELTDSVNGHTIMLTDKLQNDEE